MKNVYFLLYEVLMLDFTPYVAHIQVVATGCYSVSQKLLTAASL